MTDLSEIVPLERVVKIRHPKTGKDTGLTFSIVSLEDHKLKRIKREITDDRIKLERANKSFTAKEIEDNRFRLIFAAITAWEWGKPIVEEAVFNDKEELVSPAVYGDQASFEGEQLPFNEQNVQRVFRKLPWIADQLENEISDTKAFFQA